MTSLFQQFGNMFSSGLSFGSKGAKSPKRKAVHETITFPRFKVTPDNDSCQNPSLEREHMLTCGHIIITVKPNELCAPNCHHVASSKGPRKGANGEKPFYCDACVETENEALIPVNITSKQAEEMRLSMRQTEAENREKDTKHRKCYVSAITSSVPCNKDAVINPGYAPRKDHHAWDSSLPQVGSLIFEDILPKPLDESKQPKKKKESATTQADSSVAGDSPSNLGEYGADYLTYTQLLAEDEPAVDEPIIQATQPVRKKAVPKSTVQTPHRTQAIASGRNAKPAEAPKRRKRAIVEERDDDDEYNEEGQDEDDENIGRSRRPAKRRKTSIHAAATPIAKNTKNNAAKPSAPTPKRTSPRMKAAAATQNITSIKKKAAATTPNTAGIRKKAAATTPNTASAKNKKATTNSKMTSCKKAAALTSTSANTRKKAQPVRRSPRSKSN